MNRLLALGIFVFGAVSFFSSCVEKHYACPQGYELTDTKLCKPVHPGQVNPDTAPEQPLTPPPEMIPYIHEAGLVSHLNALFSIASSNGGTRAVGTPGYEASVTYVASYLEEAGFEVTFHEFAFETYEKLGNPELTWVDSVDTTFENEDDFTMLAYSGPGQSTALVQPVDVQLPPDENSNSSTSGCEEEDFENFEAGKIALIQRGSCTFSNKVVNAQNAGATAVIIFNEGQQGRQGLFGGTLDAENPPTIPVLGATFSVGQLIAEAATAGDVSVTVNSNISYEVLAIHNVLAQYPGASERKWVMGAHLDSVPSGPGINDNGTGVATLMEIATTMIAEKPTLPHGIQFAFWGAEEAGLVGSLNYMRDLSQQERDSIIGYLNFDMVGSPNPGRFVYDSDSTLPNPDLQIPEGSDIIEEVLNSHFETYGMSYGPTHMDGRSDYYAFLLAGIPTGGLFTGADTPMTGRDAIIYEGRRGAAHDPCYHRSCDGLENVNAPMLTNMANAAAYGIFALMERPELDGVPQAGFQSNSRKHHPASLKHIIPRILPGNCHHALKTR